MQILKDVLFSLFVLFLIGVVSFLMTPSTSVCYFDPKTISCKNNLAQLGNFLQLYRNDFGRYPPLDGGDLADNWARYMQKVKIEGESWAEISNELFVCPYRKEAGATNHPSYVFANPKKDELFHEGTFPPDLKPGTPIAGDAYDKDLQFGNHGRLNQGNKVNVLRFDKSVQSVGKQDKLFQVAYEQEVLFGTFDATEFKQYMDRKQLRESVKQYFLLLLSIIPIVLLVGWYVYGRISDSEEATGLRSS